MLMHMSRLARQLERNGENKVRRKVRRKGSLVMMGPDRKARGATTCIRRSNCFLRVGCCQGYPVGQSPNPEGCVRSNENSIINPLFGCCLGDEIKRAIVYRTVRT